MSFVTIPNYVGTELSQAVNDAISLGLNVKIVNEGGGGTVVYQSLPLGANVKKGTLIEFKALVYNYED